ncbi:MAG TPA: hypothetical protein VFP84_02050 [Kofleriaceae bacterium]|nr:hypothetical protein [Kofleriaceae bacterium]
MSGTDEPPPELPELRDRGRRVILWLGWLLFLVYAYPGYMSTDSVDQLMQARENVFRDWHPPVMAFLWRITDHLVAGPFPMLVLQSATFLLGADALLRRQLRPRAAAVAASLLLLCPPVISQMAVIWKDMQMAGYLMAGTALLLAARRGWRVLGLALLCLATAQRYNAPAATLPLVVGLFVWHRDAGWRRYATAAVAWVAITVLASAANRALTDEQTFPWHGSIAVFDIVGTVRFGPRLADDELRRVLDGVPGLPGEKIQARMRKSYEPSAWWWLSHGDTRVMDPVTTQAQRDALATAYRKLILAHPVSYLRHRWSVFVRVLGWGSNNVPISTVWTEFTGADWHGAAIKHVASHSALQGAWLAAFAAHDRSWWFRPWVYGVIALCLLPLCIRQRLALCVVLSGVLGQLGLFVAAPSSDFRYSHWMIACTLLGAVLVFAARYRRGTKASTSTQRSALHATTA